MKNKIYTSAVLVFLFLCFSCNTPKTADNKETGKTAPANTDSAAALLSKKSKDTILSVENHPEKRYDEIGENLWLNESLGELKQGLTIKKVIELLGEPEKKSKLEMDQADGANHQQLNYTKKGIEIDAVEQPGAGIIVSMITIASPCSLKTKKNIGIGSTAEEVKSAYADAIDPAETNADAIIAGSVYGGIIFSLKNNKVQTIFIGAAGE